MQLLNFQTNTSYILVQNTFLVNEKHLLITMRSRLLSFLKLIIIKKYIIESRFSKKKKKKRYKKEVFSVLHAAQNPCHRPWICQTHKPDQIAEMLDPQEMSLDEVIRNKKKSSSASHDFADRGSGTGHGPGRHYRELFRMTPYSVPLVSLGDRGVYSFEF